MINPLINSAKNQKAIRSPKLKFKCATDQEADVSPQPKEKTESALPEAVTGSNRQLTLFP